MNYKIIGHTLPAVEISLRRGEAIYTQKGGMVWQSDGITMETNTKGGVLKGIGRMFSGESFFLVTYTARQDATIAFASTVPGCILPVDTASLNGLIIQKGAFLCAQSSIDLQVEFTKKFSSGFFGGEGFILQSIHGTGYAFLEVDGDIEEKVLAPGEVLKVDTGNVVGFESTVSYEIETVKGLGNIMFGGEGLFLTKLTGPGRVFVQTMNFGELAGKINSLVAK